MGYVEKVRLLNKTATALMMVFALCVFAAAFTAQNAHARAQEAVIGTIESSPETVARPGSYQLTATGTGFIADSQILLLKCASPAPTLVPDKATSEEIVQAALAIEPLVHCAVADAEHINVDSDGNWSQKITAEIGSNFFLTAGALDGSQAGAKWIRVASITAESAGTYMVKQDAQPATKPKETAPKQTEANEAGSKETESKEAASKETESGEVKASDTQDSKDTAEETEASTSQDDKADDDNSDQELARTGAETTIAALAGLTAVAGGVMIRRETKVWTRIQKALRANTWLDN